MHNRQTNIAIGTGVSFNAASVVTDLDPDFDPQGAAQGDCILAMTWPFLVGRDAKGDKVVTVFV